MNRNKELNEITSLKLKLSGGMARYLDSEEYSFNIDGTLKYTVKTDTMDEAEKVEQFEGVLPEVTNQLFKYVKRVDFYNKFIDDLEENMFSCVMDVSHFTIEIGFKHKKEKHDLKRLELKTIDSLYNKILHIIWTIDK